MHFGPFSKTHIGQNLLQIKQGLQQSNLLELSSDASLILRQVAAIEDNEECHRVSTEFVEYYHMTHWRTKSSGPLLAQKIDLCLVKFWEELCVPEGFPLDFEAQATAFFNLASSIEDRMDSFSDLRDQQEELETALGAFNL
jgi:hypothetical protein